MALEDIYLAELQNFEMAAITVFRAFPSDVNDTDIIKTYEALEKYYRQKNMGKTPDDTNQLDEFQQAIFDHAIEGAEAFYDEQETTDAPKRRAFSSVLRKKTQEEIFIACLRKLLTSSRRWNKRNGERGYIEAINPYL